MTMVPQSYGQANVSQQQQGEQVASNSQQWPNIHENVMTDFNSNVTFPSIQGSAFIHPFAVIIGNCYIGQNVLVAPTLCAEVMREHRSISDHFLTCKMVL